MDEPTLDPYAPPEWYDPKTLISRLGGIYTIPVDDGAGLLDGKDTFTRDFNEQFARPKVQVDAANMIGAFERGEIMDARKVELLIEELKKPADVLNIGQRCIVPIHREAIARLREFLNTDT